MSDPIIEQIIEHIVTSLETITTDNGYQIQVGSGKVYRPLTPEEDERTMFGQVNGVDLIVGDPTRNKDYDISGNPPRVGWNQPVELDLIYKPDDESTVPIQKKLAIFYADAMIALFADSSDPPTDFTVNANNAFSQWGGLALTTEITEPQWFTSELNNFVAIRMDLFIQYRHKKTNPYEQ